MTKSRYLLIFLLISAFLIQGCSSNGEEEAKESQPVLGINIIDRTTTLGDSSKDELDGDIEELVSSRISQALIQGASQSDLFAKNLRTNAQDDFKNNSQVQTHSVDMSIHTMESKKGKTVITVASITQETVNQGSKSTRDGKIYFNNEGLIVGYDLSKFKTENTTDKEV